MERPAHARLRQREQPDPGRRGVAFEFAAGSMGRGLDGRRELPGAPVLQLLRWLAAGGFAEASPRPT
ncbi:MAG TPA: hypothetical protein VLT79_07610 [Gemmatimonadales bacterium]|nr:hypothetical protein [Gemmatimonadales bacterium]